MHAGFEYYRAAFARPVNNAVENKAFAQHPLAMPVLSYGGADTTKAVGPALLPAVKRLATNVQGGVIPACGHYIEEEQPYYLAQQLLTFFAGGKPRSG